MFEFMQEQHTMAGKTSNVSINTISPTAASYRRTSALVTPYGLTRIAFLGIVGSIVAGCASQIDTHASNSNCPNLEGLYSEEGLTYRGGQRVQDVSHLSWLVEGEKRTSLNSLNTVAGPGKPSIYFVRTVRVSNPSSNRFELEALNKEGKRLGLFSFGPEAGWRCADGAFEFRSESQGSGEGAWGDEISIHRITRAADGSLVRSIYSKYQQRTIFLLGASIGSPHIIDVEYRFPLIAR